MEPWFNADAYGWVPAVLSGLAGFSTGMSGEKLGPKGKGRKVIFTSLYVQIVGSLLLIAVGLFGRSAGQPYAVWSSLLIPGIIGTVVVTATIFRLQRVYRKAAQKVMVAHRGA